MRRVLLVLALIAGSLLLGGQPVQASSPGWIVLCPYSHSNNDDMIVFPGQPGASHLHDYVGNTTVNADSTYETLLAGGTTCPANTQDTAGYWIPAYYEGTTHVTPAAAAPWRNAMYYRENNVSAGYKAVHPVEPFPPNFRMVAGNSHATSEAENPYLGRELYYGCSNNSTGKLKAPPNCSTGAISTHVGFPNCWDGVTTGVDDTAHVRYPSSGVCPPDFPRVLPRLIMRFEHAVGTTTDDFSLASGPAYTLHGDFVNSWQVGALESLTAGCLTIPLDCGNNPTP